jgi:peptidoglycan/LPS O-acetylase OafA/YrhL
MSAQQPDTSSVWRTLAGLAALGFGAVVAFFLVTEHRAHLYGALPFLLLLACPVMMLFMHHGHRHQDHQDAAPGTSDPSRPPRETRP